MIKTLGPASAQFDGQLLIVDTTLVRRIRRVIPSGLTTQSYTQLSSGHEWIEHPEPALPDWRLMAVAEPFMTEIRFGMLHT